ncbi:MAG: ATPase, T2SS/T4P/T4SS family [Desulfurococcaceae archaeon]
MRFKLSIFRKSKQSVEVNVSSDVVNKGAWDSQKTISAMLLGLSIEISKRDPSWKVLDSYYVYRPFSKITIAETPTGPVYFVEEQELTHEEIKIVAKLYDIFLDEIRPPQTLGELSDIRSHVYSEIRRIIEKYKNRFGIVGAKKLKIMYYIEKYYLGYGPIDPLIRDPNIEDISCNGIGLPVYVWHRNYESIPTNIVFLNEEAINELIQKMAHMSGKHVSIAHPILDAMLPEKHRVAATYSREVSVKGPSFTIRKFRERPFSIIELIRSGNIDLLTAAYLWVLLENGKTFMIAGGTGAGKTTMLNALSMFIKPGMKIVTIEDTPELNLPHLNWVQLTGRESFIAGLHGVTSSIKLYDLVKLSLRYRPDYIIVGEVRGEEAFVLFQAMATGHSGASTIHADTLDYAVKRLTSPPMNIPPTYMKLMNVFMHVQNVITRVEKGVVKSRRRITVVQEVDDYERYRLITKWDPRTDRHSVNLKDSSHIRDVAARKGLDLEDVLEEIVRRAIVLKWLDMRNIIDPWEVSKVIFDYYYEPMTIYKKAIEDMASTMNIAPTKIYEEIASYHVIR